MDVDFRPQVFLHPAQVSDDAFGDKLIGLYQTLLWTKDGWNGFHSECVSDCLHPWFHEHHILRWWFHYAHLIIKHHCARYRKLTSQFQSFLLCFLCNFLWQNNITNLDLRIQFKYHSSSFCWVRLTYPLKIDGFLSQPPTGRRQETTRHPSGAGGRNQLSKGGCLQRI